MGEIKIHKTPAPKVMRKSPRGRYPFNTLVIGGHFVVKKEEANPPSIRVCASQAQDRYGMKFSVAEQLNGDVTVERTA